MVILGVAQCNTVLLLCWTVQLFIKTHTTFIFCCKLVLIRDGTFDYGPKDVQRKQDQRAWSTNTNSQQMKFIKSRNLQMKQSYAYANKICKGRQCLFAHDKLEVGRSDGKYMQIFYPTKDTDKQGTGHTEARYIHVNLRLWQMLCNIFDK